MFAEAYCINLSRREDKWRSFCLRDWDSLLGCNVQRFNAIDGEYCKAPKWWTAGNGAWGCYRSHLSIIEQCLNRGTNSVLLLEDDAEPVEGFAEKYKAFCNAMPSDWGMLYLGGQLLETSIRQPWAINEHVIKPFNVNRTHAYALRGDTILKVYRYLSDTKNWPINYHIDHRLGMFHAQRVHNIYAPTEWLVAQGAGKSDVSNRSFGKSRIWSNTTQRFCKAEKIVMVLGLHRSGSSMTAGMLAQLGVGFGRNFVGYEPDGGYEARELVKICEQALPFPYTRMRLSDKRATDLLRAYIAKMRTEHALPGLKYPQLCALARYVLDICGDSLRVVHADRPLQESIDSMIKRTGMDAERVRAHQEYLLRCKLEFLASMPRESVYTVDYGQACRDAAGAASGLAGWLAGWAGPEAAAGAAGAAGYVDPARRSVGPATGGKAGPKRAKKGKPGT